MALHRRISTLCLLVLLLLLGAVACSAPDSPSGSEPEGGEAVDAHMRGLDWTDGPGAVIAVIEDGEVTFARAYGHANVEHGVAMSRESVLDLGSVAKQFTAFAIVLLERDGVLGFDDDIRVHLPEIPDFGTPITIRHLVHHTSGLREIYNAKMLTGWQGGDGIEQYEALHMTMRMRELNFEPGAEYLYSNTGYMLLADIVARASGTTFPKFLAERVFEPLGMTNTTIMSSLGQSIPNAAESYASAAEGGLVRVFDNSSLFGAGGMYSTVDDVARWMMNYARGAVGGMDAIGQMKQPGVLNDGEVLDYAFGLDVETVRGLETVAHTGASAGFRSAMRFYPEIEGGVIVLTNFAGSGAVSIANVVEDAFFGDVMEPRPQEDDSSDGTGAEDGDELERPTLHPPSMAALEGRYFSPELEAVWSVRTEGDSLFLGHRRQENVPLEISGTGVFTSPVGEVRFEYDDTGAVTGMRMSNGRVRNLLFERMPD